MGWRGVSQVPAPALAQITDGLVSKGVQMSGGNVLIELLVPRGGVELGKPVAKSQEILPGELADCGFDLVDGAHVGRINRSDFGASADLSNDPCGACFGVAVIWNAVGKVDWRYRRQRRPEKQH